MKMIFYFALIVTYCLHFNVYVHSINDTSRLMADLMSGYDKRVRPIVNQEDSVRVDISVSILYVQDLDEIKGKLTFVAPMYVSWVDERISWNSSKYNNIQTIVISIGEVWTPEIVLANSAKSASPLWYDWMSIRYDANGVASWRPGGLLEVNCAVNIKYYPFDIQTCDILITPFVYTSYEVVFNSVDALGTGSLYFENGEWEFVNTSSSAIIIFGTSYYQLRITLARRPTFVIINVVLPFVIISFLNIVVFLLPADSGERISYAVTILLALAVFLTIIGENIPKTSSPLPIISFFLGAHVSLSSVICFAVILNLRLFHKSEKIPVPPWVLFCFCRKERQPRPLQTPNSRRDMLPETKINKNLANSGNRYLPQVKIFKAPMHAPERDNALYSSRFTDKQSVTWQDVSRTVDMILLCVSFLLCVTICVAFAIIII